ncbi:DUF2334 domain-containing protein [Roseateles asaccharophilus]|uniref:Deacetylase n=1 Tax=Roseateles asaccharophilus TaxID=582607 RepID=A0ABU2A2F8_9BURK|nr:DUF2334 domain-containing protein [Roseateles asaccharophilus]MDR7331270.1 putative deacetylase [Roseateles asaccharophilus]
MNTLTGLTLRAPLALLPLPTATAPRRVEACSARDLCVLLHDVSPANWEGCQRVVTELRGCADRAGVALPLTLLVVPRQRGDDTLPARYLRWLHAMAGAGHELCLHGLTHRDDRGAPRRLHDWLRGLPAVGGGEFAALQLEEAQQRLAEGRSWARALGFTMDGFAAPAWRLSPASLQAVAAAGFTHTCTPGEILSLPQRRVLAAPRLMLDGRAGRRQLSIARNRHLASSAQDARLLRLELRPGDADDPELLQGWTQLLDDALRARVPLRLGEAGQLAGHFGAPAQGLSASVPPSAAYSFSRL